MSFAFPDKNQTRPVDALCLGRAGMDLYGNEHGAGLASVSGFRVSLGGSPANIAVAMARLGCNVGCITKVANDPIGDYVEHTLRNEGVDTACLLRSQPGKLTSLALAAVQKKDCEVVIYRNQAADLELTKSEIEAMPIATSRSLLVSGTALSQHPSRQAALEAMSIARKHNLVTVLDLDYRPYTWDNREESINIYHQALALTHIAIGNKEEWQHIGGFETSSRSVVMRIVKDGANGCVVYHKDDSHQHFPAFTVTALKPYGAGDAFAAGVLQQLLVGNSLEQAVTYGSAAAALIVQADACALAMPCHEQIQTFLNNISITE